jgi:hypothetical protein
VIGDDAGVVKGVSSSSYPRSVQKSLLVGERGLSYSVAEVAVGVNSVLSGTSIRSRFPAIACDESPKQPFGGSSSSLHVLMMVRRRTRSCPYTSHQSRKWRLDRAAEAADDKSISITMIHGHSAGHDDRLLAQ